MTRFRFAALALAAAGVMAGAVARAEEPASRGGAATALAGDWKAGVEEGERDVVSGETMVVLAYGAIWVLLLVYVLRLTSQVRGLRRETDELRRMIEEPGRG